MGPILVAHVRNCWLDLQCGSICWGHGNGVETPQRQRQELEACLQGAGHMFLSLFICKSSPSGSLWILLFTSLLSRLLSLTTYFTLYTHTLHLHTSVCCCLFFWHYPILPSVHTVVWSFANLINKVATEIRWHKGSLPENLWATVSFYLIHLPIQLFCLIIFMYINIHGLSPGPDSAGLSAEDGIRESGPTVPWERFHYSGTGLQLETS